MQPTETFLLKDDGVFPNNADLPVVVYRGVLTLPVLFPALAVKRLFKKNKWSNAWQAGILTVHHYHSVTHEVLGVYKGEATLQLGGNKGVKIKLQKGDVLIIPAGVAHKNLEEQNSLLCVGAYPRGMDYDMNYGTKGERPQTDKNIKAVKIPTADPVFGAHKGIAANWWP